TRRSPTLCSIPYTTLFRSELDVCEPEPPADDPAVPKELLDLIRMRRRADVEIFRPAAQQKIADAPAHQIGDVVELPQAVQNFERSEERRVGKECRAVERGE